MARIYHDTKIHHEVNFHNAILQTVSRFMNDQIRYFTIGLGKPYEPYAFVKVHTSSTVYYEVGMLNRFGVKNYAGGSRDVSVDTVIGRPKYTMLPSDFRFVGKHVLFNYKMSGASLHDNLRANNVIRITPSDLVTFMSVFLNKVLYPGYGIYARSLERVGPFVTVHSNRETITTGATGPMEIFNVSRYHKAIKFEDVLVRGFVPTYTTDWGLSDDRGPIMEVRKVSDVGYSLTFSTGEDIANSDPKLLLRSASDALANMIHKEQETLNQFDSKVLKRENLRRPKGQVSFLSVATLGSMSVVSIQDT